MTSRYEVQYSETLGRYLIAAKDLRPGEAVITEEPFLLGPNFDSGLVCFNCHLPLISKFFVCKQCAVAPICPEGCQDHLTKWHNKTECDFFRDLKLMKGLGPLTMVQNVGALCVARALLRRRADPQGWAQFCQLQTHLDERRESGVGEYCESIEKFIQSLDLLDAVTDKELVQKICAAIDVNSFEVRGPMVPGLGAAETLRGVYLKAALINHDCMKNTHVAISDNNVLSCRASTEIKKGDVIYINYTDHLKGTAIRQQHLQIGKYFKCSCRRCSDPTELGTHMSSALCPRCKTGCVAPSLEGKWQCNSCTEALDAEIIMHKVQCCSDKLDVINKKDEKELEEYIKFVSLVLAPNHYLLFDAKQRLAGVLRDSINSEPRPSRRCLRRKLQLCRELLPVLEALSPGICRTKAITLYELHATMVQLAKKLFDAREITESDFLNELLSAEKYLKRSLEILFVEPGNSPEGELCAKALEEYRALKAAMNTALDALHAVGKTYVSEVETDEAVQPVL